MDERQVEGEGWTAGKEELTRCPAAAEPKVA